MQLTEPDIFAIERPHGRLLWLYMIRAIATGPMMVILIPLFFFRYETLRYRFDAEGIHMRWGLLFRRQINLTYSRIQDIHLTSGLIQRWFGLADVQVQTASGSAGAEMTIEGLLEYEAVRDFLYTRMRGYRDQPRQTAVAAQHGGASGSTLGESQATALLREMIDELRATRVALEKITPGSRGGEKPGNV